MIKKKSFGINSRESQVFASDPLSFFGRVYIEIYDIIIYLVARSWNTYENK